MHVPYVTATRATAFAGTLPRRLRAARLRARRATAQGLGAVARVLAGPRALFVALPAVAVPVLAAALSRTAAEDAWLWAWALLGGLSGLALVLLAVTALKGALALVGLGLRRHRRRRLTRALARVRTRVRGLRFAAGALASLALAPVLAVEAAGALGLPDLTGEGVARALAAAGAVGCLYLGLGLTFARLIQWITNRRTTTS